MKRLSPCVLGILLATGCVTKQGTTTPNPVPSGPPNRWTGTATFTNQVEYDNGASKDDFVLEVTWVKADNPNPPPPPGTTRYVPSGRGQAFIQSYIDLGGTCTVDRNAQFPIAVTDEPLSPGDQVLDLAADGQYQGKLTGGWLLDYIQFCPDRAFQQRGMVRVALDIRGTLEGGRMHGTMQPYVLTGTNLTSTSTGSWNFSAN